MLAFIYEGDDVLIIDLGTGDQVGRIVGAGGGSCQEVLWDVSFSLVRLHTYQCSSYQRYRSDLLSMYVGIDDESCVVDLDIA